MEVQRSRANAPVAISVAGDLNTVDLRASEALGPVERVELDVLRDPR